MERMAARVFCTVLLCLAGCWSSTDAAPGLNRTINPGVCPVRVPHPEMCALLQFVPCADDSECAYNQKCCDNGCGRECMVPNPEKPGMCPKTNAELVRCIRKDDELCADDGLCPDNEKCCNTACGGRQCMAPVTANPGVCPGPRYEPIECTWIKFTSCVNDRDCANNEKCCNNGCGLQCMAPVTDVCKLPLDPGPCEAYMPMWGFDSAAGKCVSFVYGGCQGNDNRFNSQKECEKSCGVRHVNPGVCPGPRYEPAVCTWIKFTSCVDDSDCANNEKCCNNGCGLQCMAPVKDACRLPLDPGPCKVYKPMWGFDSAAGKCVRFVYGGCQGNDNRFNSQKECEKSCGVRNVNPGVCPGPRYEPAECTWIKFTSCADDGDCANNEKCCSNGCGLQCMAPVKDVCRLPLDPGPCEAHKPMWGFDSAAGKCVSFIYGGCKGNGNRFNTQKECEKSCGVRHVNPGVCPGPRYEPAECTWIKFTSCADDGDCANNEKCCSNGCGLQCMAPVKDVCRLPLDPGPCEAHKPMWGFDSAAGKCVSFVYGGCKGNGNRFNTQKECEKSCGVRHVNPGVCPRRKYEVAMCPRVTFVSCDDDGDCASNEKCCTNGCGRQCMAAVTAKPGVCPAKKYKPPMCARIKFVSCADDSDCTNNQKCCNNGCGLQCMDPVKVKPGVCPVRKSKPGMCPLMNFMSCADDTDCAGNEKCCSNGCGLDCMTPVTGPLPY